MTGEYVLEGLAVPESLNLLHDLLDRVGRDHPDVDSADLMLFETAVVKFVERRNENAFAGDRPDRLGQIRSVR